MPDVPADLSALDSKRRKNTNYDSTDNGLGVDNCSVCDTEHDSLVQGVSGSVLEFSYGRKVIWQHIKQHGLTPVVFVHRLRPVP